MLKVQFKKLLGVKKMLDFRIAKLYHESVFYVSVLKKRIASYLFKSVW